MQKPHYLQDDRCKAFPHPCGLLSGLQSVFNSLWFPHPICSCAAAILMLKFRLWLILCFHVSLRAIREQLQVTAAI